MIRSTFTAGKKVLLAFRDNAKFERTIATVRPSGEFKLVGGMAWWMPGRARMAIRTDGMDGTVTAGKAK